MAHPRVLVFQHVRQEGIGLIAGALDERGAQCRVLSLSSQPQPVPDLADIAGLIVMGGPMSANDDHAWLRQEMDAIRQAVHRGIPVLGICLGAQLVAKALGARVYRNPEKEIGWFPLDWTPAAQTDGLFAGFAGSDTVFQWHGETFDLPAGALHLAYSGACRNQAFRAGENVYGLQFHLEVTPEMIADWIRQDAACGDARECRAPIDPHAHAAPLAAMAQTVFSRWCGLLR